MVELETWKAIFIGLWVFFGAWFAGYLFREHLMEEAEHYRENYHPELDVDGKDRSGWRYHLGDRVLYLGLTLLGGGAGGAVAALAVAAIGTGIAELLA